MPCALLSSSCWICFAAASSAARRAGWTGCRRCSARLRDLQLRLPGRHVDLVVVQRVQRRGGGRGHPGGVRAGLRMADLRLQHVGHQVGHRPHALADLRVARQAAQPARCRRWNPRRPGSRSSAFMSPLRIIGPASIEVWISSPVRSRKPVLMKKMRSLAARMHSFRFSVVRRSSSMMPILSV